VSKHVNCQVCRVGISHLPVVDSPYCPSCYGKILEEVASLTSASKYLTETYKGSIDISLLLLTSIIKQMQNSIDLINKIYLGSEEMFKDKMYYSVILEILKNKLPSVISNANNVINEKHPE